MWSDAFSLLSLLVSLVALALAYRADRNATQANDTTACVFHTIESRNSRTVICDLQDGRITVIKELKDAA